VEANNDRHLSSLSVSLSACSELAIVRAPKSLQNEAEANGGGLRDPEAVLREPDRREPAAEARARAAAAVGGGGGRALRAAPAAGRGDGHRLPVLREGHRDDERRRDKQELQQLFLLSERRPKRMLQFMLGSVR
jgi:hypothetical protein